jgi:hypothetical protein
VCACVRACKEATAAATESTTFLDTPVISELEISQTLQHLNISKANGPDCIINRILKHIEDNIAPSLTYLFNKSLNDCCFPSPWKYAQIIPILKKNDKREIQKKNYRPVSLLSNIGKCVEGIIHTKMYNHFCTHNLLTWRNSGFKKSDSTINQLIYLVHQIHGKRAGHMYGIPGCK